MRTSMLGSSSVLAWVVALGLCAPASAAAQGASGSITVAGEDGEVAVHGDDDLVLAARGRGAIAGREVALALSLDGELRAIDAQSTTATALYVISPVLLLASGFAAAGATVRSVCIVMCSGANATTTALLGASALALVGSLVTLVVAISFDVDSGNRRGRRARRLEERASGQPSLSVRVGGLSLGVEGTF